MRMVSLTPSHSCKTSTSERIVKISKKNIVPRRAHELGTPPVQVKSILEGLTVPYRAQPPFAPAEPPVVEGHMS